MRRASPLALTVAILGLCLYLQADPPKPGDALKLRDLFQIVGGFDATDVLIDDRPVPYARELWLPLVWFLIPR